MAVALVCLAVALAATACVASLHDDEAVWCRDHPQEVVAASYGIGGPMTLPEVLGDMEADTPPPEYVRACRAAYRDR